MTADDVMKFCRDGEESDSMFDEIIETRIAVNGTVAVKKYL